MKQLSLFSIFTFVLLLLAPNLAAALYPPEVAEIPYQINNSDRIVIGTVSEIEVTDYYMNNTITVKEWLYNPLPENTIIVRTNRGLEDEAEFTKNESVLLMLKDQRPDKGVFRMSFGFPGKHPVSDRDAVIKELKAQGKWKGENQNENGTNNIGATSSLGSGTLTAPKTTDTSGIQSSGNDGNIASNSSNVGNENTSSNVAQTTEQLTTSTPVVTSTTTKQSTKTPGFEIISSITGILAVFLYKRR